MNISPQRDSGAGNQNGQSPEKLPPMAAGMVWVSRITTISLEMVLPAVGGSWLDRKLGTSYVAVLGVLFGGALGFWHLLKLAGAAGNGGSTSASRTSTNRESSKESKP